MKIAIIGAGAMGCLFAGMLKRAGLDVWLIEKNKERVDAVIKGGLTLEQKEGRWHSAFDTITSAPETVGFADLIIIFVKAYDTGAAVKAASPFIPENTTVVTLQNGLGNIEAIAESVADKQILAGTTAHGATLLGHGHIRHAGIGDTVIGPNNPSGTERAHAVKELFEGAGISTFLSDDISSVLWGKLIVNIGINPLTAIMRIKNGQILKSPHLVSIMHSVVQEGMTVAEKLGIVLPFPDPVKKVEDVSRATAENISSMHQDVKAGRKTEIAHINGAVTAAGQKVNVPTPVNSMLTDLVLSMEQIQPEG
jgi:2-dehydropantoate 2-reductase